jgi:NAD(P)-dependent dehydrogenase (short-subunit alcohol dehydrogenase family)
MKAIVITGSTRGIGFGLAKEFLKRGCAVAIAGRNADALSLAVAELVSGHSLNNVYGQVCDVTDFDSLQQLWDASERRFGRVDIWINNAGISHRQADIPMLTAEDLRAVIGTNILGTLYGASVAMRGMRARGGGAIYNLEGLGSDGRRMRGIHLYGMSKYAVSYITDALADEAEGSGVIVGAIRPGMVLTELITTQFTGREADWRRLQRMFRIVASSVEEVAPRIAAGVLANKRNRARIRAGGMMRMLGRIIRLQRLVKDR